MLPLLPMLGNVLLLLLQIMGSLQAPSWQRSSFAIKKTSTNHTSATHIMDTAIEMTTWEKSAGRRAQR